MCVCKYIEGFSYSYGGGGDSIYSVLIFMKEWQVRGWTDEEKGKKTFCFSSGIRTGRTTAKTPLLRYFEDHVRNKGLPGDDYYDNPKIHCVQRISHRHEGLFRRTWQ